jgi:ribosomal protein L40E
MTEAVVQKSIFCTHCGQQNEPDAIACSACGHVLQEILRPRKVRENRPLEVGEIVGMLLLSCIPVIGLFLLFYWALDKNASQARRNFAQALIIFTLTLLCVLFVLLYVAVNAIRSYMDAWLGYGTWWEADGNYEGSEYMPWEDTDTDAAGLMRSGRILSFSF